MNLSPLKLNTRNSTMPNIIYILVVFFRVNNLFIPILITNFAQKINLWLDS